MQIKGNILVVDDDNKVYRQICGFPGCKNYMIDYATNVEEAESMLRSDKYDVVFLDLVLPGLSGLEVIEDIKRITKKIPKVILITAYHAEGLERQAIDLGACRCIHKPLDEVEVVTTIETCLGKA